MRFLFLLLLTLAAGLSVRAQNGDKAGEAQPPPNPAWVIPSAPALRPEDQLRTFKVPTGFHVELVAADPLVHDPVAMTIAPDGRLWVVEMADYMQDLEGRGANERNGRIVILSDTDGDGRMDKRSVFLDGLELPRAVSLVDDGALVIEPPHLWFVRDTNGDGVADSKVEIADDFGTRLNIEYLPNGLLWSLDNWIYNASLSLTASGNKTLRFRYEGGGKFTRESTVTRGQWGISQDSTGRLYYNSNSDPLRFEAIPAAYLSRNPGFAAAGANVQLVPALLKVWPGRITTGINRGYKTLDANGRMYFVTAACSPLVYRGAIFPPEFRGDVFVAEPTGNLIKRIKLTEKDGAVLGANAYEGTEFLTSTDERFRPLNLYNGPDGALWIVDFYRGLIQEREFITTYLRKQVEARGLERPIGLGRIWRVVPDATPALKLEPTLAQATPLQLVDALGDGNGWTRDTAQRLLVEKRAAVKDPAVAAALRKMAVNGRNSLGR
jgi:putative membrane-bound dehydrogenase-like protein